MQEVKLGRIAGPFSTKPISFMTALQLVCFKRKWGGGGYRLITTLSYPPGLSVNEHIDIYASVRYSSFDNAVNMVETLGKGCLIGTSDIKSAFKLLPCFPGEFDLLGIKLHNEYFIDKMAPMGLKLLALLGKK